MQDNIVGIKSHSYGSHPVQVDISNDGPTLTIDTSSYDRQKSSHLSVVLYSNRDYAQCEAYCDDDKACDEGMSYTVNYFSKYKNSELLSRNVENSDNNKFGRENIPKI